MGHPQSISNIVDILRGKDFKHLIREPDLILVWQSRRVTKTILLGNDGAVVGIQNLTRDFSDRAILLLHPNFN